jgi:hypothetical protein
MSVDTTIRNAFALGLLRLYRARRKTIVFENADDGEVTLYADYKNESTELAEVLGFEAEKTARKFFVPRQTNFPPADGVRPGALITVESKDYKVEKIDEAGDESPQFEIICSRNIAVTGGVI